MPCSKSTWPAAGARRICNGCRAIANASPRRSAPARRAEKTRAQVEAQVRTIGDEIGELNRQATESETQQREMLLGLAQSAARRGAGRERMRAKTRSFGRGAKSPRWRRRGITCSSGRGWDSSISSAGRRSVAAVLSASPDAGRAAAARADQLLPGPAHARARLRGNEPAFCGATRGADRHGAAAQVSRSALPLPGRRSFPRPDRRGARDQFSPRGTAAASPNCPKSMRPTRRAFGGKPAPRASARAA